MSIHRRLFLKGSAVVMAGVGATPGWLARAAEVAPGRKKVLVAIFLRGAADGLNIVVPFGEKRYYAMRPNIAVQAPSGIGPGQGPSAIDLDGHFGLHSSLEPLKPLWDRGQLAIVTATGSPDPSRSHFDAQDYMESGTPGKTLGDGWLNRALPPADEATSPVRAITASPEMPHTMRGERSAIAIGNIQPVPPAQQALLEAMYSRAGNSQLNRSGRDAFAAAKILRGLKQTPPNPQYSQGGDLGRSLQQIANLIKADVGVEVAFAEVGGWDHHQNETVALTPLLRQFAMALSAFSSDLGDRMEDVVVVTMSEFGRTAEENGNGGTDHGHGNLMFVLGGSVAGGKIYGQWPGLEHEQLNEGRDLAVTTDFRTVLSELVGAQLNQPDLSRVFPGFRQTDPMGLIKT